MIVTCPGCGSKYRVRNESVPTDGARMRCPKCDTLFLARPPSAAEQASSMHDDPSSMFQQLDPARTGSGAIPSLPPQQTPAAPLPTPGVPQQPQASGPITALFQAFDPGALPPEAQRPPPPQPQPPAAAPAPSGLELGLPSAQIGGAPRVRVSSGPPPPPPQPRGTAPSQGRVLASYAALGAGALVFLIGFTFFAWSTELLPLDRALQPFFERTFGVEPARSMLGPPPPSEEELRRLASAAEARGDVPSAIVLWRRTKVRNPAHPLAAQQLPKLRQSLGEPAEEP